MDKVRRLEIPLWVTGDTIFGSIDSSICDEVLNGIESGLVLHIVTVLK